MTTREAVDECRYCGADLYLNEPHDCPVGGNVILITMDTRRQEMETGKCDHAVDNPLCTHYDQDESQSWGMRERCEQAAARYEQRIREIHARRYGCVIWIEYEQMLPDFQTGRPTATALIGCPTHNVGIGR